MILTACDNNKNTDVENSTEKSSTEELSNNKEKEVKTFKEDLDSSENEIWYLTEGEFTKDTKVESIYLINDKKISPYELNVRSEIKTIGELSKMQDDDIISYFKEGREKIDLSFYEGRKASLFSTDPVSYKIKIKTDASGNNTAAEQISADFEKVKNGNGYVFKYNFTADSINYLIYDQEYLGFEVGFKWDDPWKEDYRTRMLRKKKSENDLILIDEPTTEGIEVDGN